MPIPRTIEHPAVWDESELTRRVGWMQALSEVEVQELTLFRDRVDVAGEQALIDGRPYEECLWPDVRLPRLEQRVAGIRDELEDGCGIVRLDGFPSGPGEGLMRALFWVLSLHLGTPVSQSGAGEKIFSVRDAGFAADDPRSRGPNSRRRLSFHTDRADVTGFLCLRQAASGGANEVVSSMAVYNEILRRRPDLVPVLMEPFCYLRHTVDVGNRQPWCRQPVFSFAEGHFACCYLRVLIERAHQDPRLPDLTSRQIEALDLVDEVAGESGRAIRFRQEPGDLVLINNWVVAHRRDEFDDPSPGSARHILRVWLSMPNSRPIDPLFRENWGSVEAGGLRGGMAPSTTT